MALPGWLRDAIVLVAVFGLLLGGLYAYTGSWPPAVIVESGSMMHKECGPGENPPRCDPGVKYGRIGTIDPGDLVLVKDVDDPEDVTTLVEGGKERYGMPGDVIVYYKANDRGQTPIIHRAVAYVVMEGEPGAAVYLVRWGDSACEGGATKLVREGQAWCQYGSEGIYIPSIPVQGPGSTPASPNPYRPTRTGFLTKGDNPSTNPTIDQQTGLSVDERGNPVPVQMEWVEGKGRAELPWLGLIKLALANKQNENSPPAAWMRIGNAYAPQDLWVMLGITLFLLVGVPLIYDGYKAYQARQGAKAMPGAPSTINAQLTDHGSVALSWSHVDGSVHSYRIYRGDERIGSTPETSYEDLRAAAGNTYSYSVSAVNEHGNEGPRSPAAAVHLP